MKREGEFARGTVLLDRHSLTMGFGPLSRDDPGGYNEISVYYLAQVVESLVLYDSLAVMLQFYPDDPYTFEETRQAFSEAYHYLGIGNLVSYIGDPVMRDSYIRVEQRVKREGLDIFKIPFTSIPKEHADYYFLGVATSTILQYYYAASRRLPYAGMFFMFSRDEMRRYFNVGDELPLAPEARVMEQIAEAARERQARMNAVLSASRFSLDVPLVFNHVLEKARRQSDIIPAALEVRESKEARAFRTQMRHLDEAIEVGDDQVIADIAEELADKVGSLRRRIDQPAVSLQVSFPLSVGFDPFGLWKIMKNRRRRHLTFIDHLYGSAAVSRPVKLRLARLR